MTTTHLALASCKLLGFLHQILPTFKLIRRGFGQPFVDFKLADRVRRILVLNDGPGAAPSIYTFGGDRETFSPINPFNYLQVDNDVWRFTLIPEPTTAMLATIAAIVWLILIPDRALSMEIPGLPTRITHAAWRIRIPAHSDSSRGGPPPVSLAEIDW